MSGDDHRQAVVLMIVRFGVLVNKQQARAVEKVLLALLNLLQFAEQIGKFLDVPAADVAHDPLAVRTI